MRGLGAGSTIAESTSIAAPTTDTKPTVLADQTPFQLVAVAADEPGSDITGVAVIDRQREREGEPVRTTAWERLMDGPSERTNYLIGAIKLRGASVISLAVDSPTMRHERKEAGRTTTNGK